ncbi:MAG: hypothetical protein ACR2L8_09195 [Solirubrobacteraceae bacterium]
MENINRAAVDVAPQQAHPGLALVLALLSIPGSTIAWSLPAGGLWIGLPLGIAAIAIGIRARRRLADRAPLAMATAAIAIGALAIGQMVVYSLALA